MGLGVRLTPAMSWFGLRATDAVLVKDDAQLFEQLEASGAFERARYGK